MTVIVSKEDVATQTGLEGAALDTHVEELERYAKLIEDFTGADSVEYQSRNRGQRYIMKKGDLFLSLTAVVSPDDGAWFIVEDHPSGGKTL